MSEYAAQIIMDNERRLIVIRRGIAVDQDEVFATEVAQQSCRGIDDERRTADDEQIGILYRTDRARDGIVV